MGSGDGQIDCLCLTCATTAMPHSARMVDKLEVVMRRSSTDAKVMAKTIEAPRLAKVCRRT